MDYKNDFNSDDDFDCSNGYSDSSYNGTNGSGQSSQMSNTHGLSKAELRKTNKPIMEKRRRARINHCLNELKSLILEAMKKDPARHTKLEKADILEMTVKHLQSVQRQQLNMAIQTDPTVVHKFKTGFMECAEEVNRYINQLEGVDVMVRQRLINHLNNCATNLEQLGSMSNFTNGYRSQLGMGMAAAAAASMGGNMGMSAPGGLFGAALAAGTLSSMANAAAAAAAAGGTAPGGALFAPLPSLQDMNNNNSNSAPPAVGGVGSGGGVAGVAGGFINNITGATGAPAAHLPPVQMGGVQLIPSRLPSGEFALIMPTTHATNLLNNNAMNNNSNDNSNPSNPAAPFANFPHARNIPSAATSPVVVAAASTNNASAASVAAAASMAILPHATVPINNDFAANYKRLSAFSRPPVAPVPILPLAVGVPIVSGSNPPLAGALLATKSVPQQTPQHPQPQQQQQKQQPQPPPPQRNASAQQLHQQSSTATNSPPLSPISTLSSQCDDSLMHTSSDFTGSRPATPPLDVTGGDQSTHPNFSGVFSTPNSAETSSLSCSTTSLSSAAAAAPLHLQQQQVTSTSGGGGGSNSTATSSCNTSTSSNNNQHDCSDSGVEMSSSLKRRSLDDEEADSSDASETATPASKRLALEQTKSQSADAHHGKRVVAVMMDGQQQQQHLVKQKHRLQELKEDSDSMWRPW